MSAALRVGVVTFPGSNGDRDFAGAIASIPGLVPVPLWHDRAEVGAVDAVVLPGGFSYGDYLRPGAIARFSRILAGVEAFVAGGGPVLGVCNGFQILCEAGLLPGTLARNANGRFVCRWTEVEVGGRSSPWTPARGWRLRLPIAHGHGRWTVDDATWASIEAEDRVVLRYCDNPNGSRGDVAGICDSTGRVVGMMPHPERACDPALGGVDGRAVLEALLRDQVQ
jgi:phosphoribosylformylglycinamidine synthase I